MGSRWFGRTSVSERGRGIVSASRPHAEWIDTECAVRGYRDVTGQSTSGADSTAPTGSRRRVARMSGGRECRLRLSRDDCRVSMLAWRPTSLFHFSASLGGALRERTPGARAVLRPLPMSRHYLRDAAPCSGPSRVLCNESNLPDAALAARFRVRVKTL